MHDILRYFPDIEGDPEAALFLSKAVAQDLQERVKQLMEQLERARKENPNPNPNPNPTPPTLPLP